MSATASKPGSSRTARAEGCGRHPDTLRHCNGMRCSALSAALACTLLTRHPETPVTARQRALQRSLAHVFPWGHSCNSQCFRSSQRFKEGSLVPLAPTQKPALLLLFCSICRAAQPGSTGRAGRQDRAGHGTADTAKAKGTTRTNSAWLGHNVPAAAQLKSHLLLSAKQGPALEFSQGKICL